MVKVLLDTTESGMLVPVAQVHNSLALLKLYSGSIKALLRLVPVAQLQNSLALLRYTSTNTDAKGGAVRLQANGSSPYASTATEPHTPSALPGILSLIRALREP